MTHDLLRNIIMRANRDLPPPARVRRRIARQLQ
jgi:hypothetical protein